MPSGTLPRAKVISAPPLRGLTLVMVGAPRLWARAGEQRAKRMAIVATEAAIARCSAEESSEAAQVSDAEARRDPS